MRRTHGSARRSSAGLRGGPWEGTRDAVRERRQDDAGHGDGSVARQAARRPQYGDLSDPESHEGPSACRRHPGPSGASHKLDLAFLHHPSSMPTFWLVIIRAADEHMDSARSATSRDSIRVLRHLQDDMDPHSRFPLETDPAFHRDMARRLKVMVFGTGLGQCRGPSFWLRPCSWS